MDEWVLDAVRWASNEGCTDEEYDSLMSIIANHFPDITGHTPPRRHGTKNPHEHTKDILERVLRHHTSGRRQNCVICRGSSVPCLVSQDMTKALAALRDDLASVNKARTVLRTRADVIGESDLRDRSSAAVLEAFLLLSDVFQDSRDSKIPPAPAEDLQSETTDHTAGQVEKVLRAFDIAEGNGHFYGVLSRAICKAVRTPEVSQGTVCKFKIGDVLRYQAWAGANMPTLTTEQPVDAIRVRKVPGETPVIQYEFFNDGVIRVVDEPDCALVTPAPNAIVAPTSLINSPPDHGGSYE